MSTEYGFIILRDLPKEEARIDVFFSEIEEVVEKGRELENYLEERGV